MNEMMLFNLRIYEDGRITDKYPKVILWESDQTGYLFNIKITGN